MSDRQYAEPLVIRGLGNKSGEGQASHLRRLLIEGDDRKLFNEQWFQDLLYKFPSLLPAAEIEPAFDSLKAIAKELPVAGKFADLLLINPAGYIALVETKLIRNPEAKREVIAQTLDYACEMSGWTYKGLVEAVKKATKSPEADPLLHAVRQVDDGDSFNENSFVENVTRNLRKGRFLLLVVGDDITSEAERMVEFIQRTPHLHFTLGLVEFSLFHEKEESIDPLFVQPRVVAKTKLEPRIVIDITLADGIQMKSQVKQDSPAHVVRTTISSEAFFEQLKKMSPQGCALAEWALVQAEEHQLIVDWGTLGPSLKFEDAGGQRFNFGQLRKDGGFSTTNWLPRFTILGLPQDIALDYLDEIIGMVPGSYRKEYNYDHEIKAQCVLYGTKDDWLPLEKLAPHKEQWFKAIDKAIERIRKVRGKS